MKDKRLSIIADMVDGRCLADIGTDHAHLPIELVKRGKIERAFACDINLGPLSAAQENIKKSGLSEKITTVLADGLTGISPADADVIVIAGMGGMTVIDVIRQWEKQLFNGKQLILQPMKNQPELRKYLLENGFDILSETAVLDKNHCYTIMDAAYTGQSSVCDTLFAVCGKHLEQDNAQSRKYIDKQIARLQKQAVADPEKLTLIKQIKEKRA